MAIRNIEFSEIDKADPTMWTMTATAVMADGRIVRNTCTAVETMIANLPEPYVASIMQQRLWEYMRSQA